MYYNYHGQIRKLIKENRLISYEFVENYNGIKPALVLYFEGHRPMPVRDYRWNEYLPYLTNIKENN